MNSRRYALPAAALALAVLVTVPLQAANKEHQQMMADLRMLQQQAQLLQAQLGALADALKTVSARLDEQAGINRKAAADARLQVDAVAADLRVVREKIDETNVRLGGLSQEVEALRQAQMSVQPPPAAAPGQTAGDAAPAAALPPSPTGPGVSPQRLFESARADYYAGQWSLAVQGFETYIKTFPKSDLTDDAQYYIGETHYSAGKFREAIAAYDRLIATYPGSNTLPDAYYKRGLAYNQLGEVKLARESFDFVVKTHPDSDAGRLAKQALDRLTRSGR